MLACLMVWRFSLISPFGARLYGTQAFEVVNPSGSIAGYIPGPSRGLISVAFSGPNKRTLFGVVINPVGIYAIDAIDVQAQGIQNRPK
jgi:hypothetical protein